MHGLALLVREARSSAAHAREHHVGAHLLLASGCASVHVGCQCHSSLYPCIGRWENWVRVFIASLESTYSTYSTAVGAWVLERGGGNTHATHLLASVSLDTQTDRQPERQTKREPERARESHRHRHRGAHGGGREVVVTGAVDGFSSCSWETLTNPARLRMP